MTDYYNPFALTVEGKSLHYSIKVNSSTSTYLPLDQSVFLFQQHHPVVAYLKYSPLHIIMTSLQNQFKPTIGLIGTPN